MPRLLTSCGLGAACSLLVLLVPAPAPAADRADVSSGTAFRYQGRLQHEGTAAEGRFDLSFELFDADQGGRSLGRVDRFDVPVQGGSFAAELDFGHAVLSGDPVWLEVLVRPAGEAAFTALEPRQRLASGALCTVAGDVLITGTLGVGVSAASAPLHLPAAPDAEAGSGGVLVVGPVAGANVAMDGNEIMARNAGAPSTLYLNNDGGTVAFGGAIDIGYQIVQQTIPGNGASIYCPAGLKVLGGGCSSSDNPPDPIFSSRPATNGSLSGWLCHYDDEDDSNQTVYAICARVQ